MSQVTINGWPLSKKQIDSLRIKYFNGWVETGQDRNLNLPKELWPYYRIRCKNLDEYYLVKAIKPERAIVKVSYDSIEEINVNSGKIHSKRPLRIKITYSQEDKMPYSFQMIGENGENIGYKTSDDDRKRGLNLLTSILLTEFDDFVKGDKFIDKELGKQLGKYFSHN